MMTKSVGWKHLERLVFVDADDDDYPLVVEQAHRILPLGVVSKEAKGDPVMASRAERQPKIFVDALAVEPPQHPLFVLAW